MPSRILATAAVGIVLIAAGACGPVDGSPATAGTAATTGTLPRAEALQQLETLAVGEWASMSGYSRDRFDHWSTQTDGCDTRDEVLRRDGTAVTVTADCKIVEGTWFSVYDGETFSDPQSVDIDHMVPLANAWRTGASAWSDEQREQFANDLERPQLHAVGRSVNRSKGDQDPSQWRPPRATYWCAYAQDWVAVKAYWQLSVTADEKAALTEMLDTCP